MTPPPCALMALAPPLPSEFPPVRTIQGPAGEGRTQLDGPVQGGGTRTGSHVFYQPAISRKISSITKILDAHTAPQFSQLLHSAFFYCDNKIIRKWPQSYIYGTIYI